jgi:pyruvate/2-oxoglutarate dehydrogenase complex dihydrolipoamide dehydrogenase (E3) component
MEKVLIIGGWALAGCVVARGLSRARNFLLHLEKESALGGKGQNYGCNRRRILQRLRGLPDRFPVERDGFGRTNR